MFILSLCIIRRWNAHLVNAAAYAIHCKLKTEKHTHTVLMLLLNWLTFPVLHKSH